MKIFYHKYIIDKIILIWSDQIKSDYNQSQKIIILYIYIYILYNHDFVVHRYQMDVGFYLA
jgi:hypothetical protein